MLKQIEGSHAVAEAVALSRPEVICAYPDFAADAHRRGAGRDGEEPARWTPCEFINVECEFAAMCVAIGASAAGARTYTATASQGLLFMAEAVYNASGLGLPIVMTVANRAIGAPINIWNDHSDSMSQRDCGWIQLFAESNQEALDLHIQAFKLAEELSHAGDGLHGRLHPYPRLRARGHARRRQQVDAFLPPYEPRQLLDPGDPVSIGAMVGPEAFIGGALPGARQAAAGARADPAHRRRIRAALRPRRRRAACAPYRTEDAETIVVALGSVLGTLKDTVDEMRDDGLKIGVLGITSFRPFPLAAVRAALQDAKRVVVLEKSFSVGLGGVVVDRRPDGLVGLHLQVLHGRSPAWAAGPSPRPACTGSCARPLPTRSHPLHVHGPRLAHRQSCSSQTRAPDAAQRPDRGEHPASTLGAQRSL